MIAGNRSGARRQRFISIISMTLVLIASITMVLVAASATGATVSGDDEHITLRRNTLEHVAQDAAQVVRAAPRGV